MSLRKLPSGLRIKDLTLGTGSLATRGSLVTIHYRCYLNHGDSCGNSYDTGQPLRMVLGRRHAIAGFEYGVEGMKVGGLRSIVVSPHLAYRDQTVSGIPANAALRFEVELNDVEDDDSSLG